MGSQALDCLSACPRLGKTWVSRKTFWKGKLVSRTALAGGLRGAGHEPGSGEDQEAWI